MNYKYLIVVFIFSMADKIYAREIKYAFEARVDRSEVFARVPVHLPDWDTVPPTPYDVTFQALLGKSIVLEFSFENDPSLNPNLGNESVGNYIASSIKISIDSIDHVVGSGHLYIRAGETSAASFGINGVITGPNLYGLPLVETNPHTNGEQFLFDAGGINHSIDSSLPLHLPLDIQTPTLMISYADADYVAVIQSYTRRGFYEITSVPLPSTASLFLSGLLILAVQRKRTPSEHDAMTNGALHQLFSTKRTLR